MNELFSYDEQIEFAKALKKLLIEKSTMDDKLNACRLVAHYIAFIEDNVETYENDNYDANRYSTLMESYRTKLEDSVPPWDD
jgi:hypothetical protein